MKKVLFSLGLAGLMLTSCQNDEPIVGPEGGEQQVSFTLAVPEAIQTRGASYSDSKAGSLTNVDNYNVTFTAALYLQDELVWSGQKAAGNQNSVEFNPTLIIGENYKLVAYAEHNVNATETGLDAITVETPALTETVDEFFLSTDIETAPQMSGVLKRPYGKLRLLAEDLAEAERQFNSTIKSVEVVYTDNAKHYTKFDAKDGVFEEESVANNTKTAEIADYAADNGFKTIFADYLPVNGTEAAMFPFTVEVTFADGTVFTRDFKYDIPVKRNYVTTLTGNLFTMDSELTLIVDEEFEGEETTEFNKQLEWIALNGGTVVLEDDVVLDKALKIANGVSAVIDLNGHSISYTSDVAASSAMITVNNGSSLTIKDATGTGKVSYAYTGTGDSNFGWGTYTIANNGTLVVENGTIEMLCDLNGNGSAVHMYCAIHQGWGASSTTINGGKISTPTYRSIRVNQGKLTINDGVMEGQVWMQPSADNTAITINGGSFAPRGVDGSSVFVTNDSKDVAMKVTAGTFETKIGCSNFTKNGVKGSVSGGTFGAPVNDNLLADGYQAVQDGSVWVVVADDIDAIVRTASELQAAIDAATGQYGIALADDITGTIIVTEANGRDLTINGNDYKFNGQLKIKGKSNKDDNHKLLIKNINFETSVSGQYCIFTYDREDASNYRYANNVTIDNCTFTASGAAVYTAVGAHIQQAYNIKLTNCKAYNMHSLMQAESNASAVSVDNALISNCKNGVSFNRTKEASISNSTIESVGAGGYGIRVKGQDNGYGIKVANCNVEAFIPLLVRNMTASNYNVALEGTNNFIANNLNGYQIVFCNEDYDENTTPSTPTGNYTLTGAEGMNVFGK